MFLTFPRLRDRFPDKNLNIGSNSFKTDIKFLTVFIVLFILIVTVNTSKFKIIL